MVVVFILFLYALLSHLLPQSIGGLDRDGGGTQDSITYLYENILFCFLTMVVSCGKQRKPQLCLSTCSQRGTTQEVRLPDFEFWLPLYSRRGAEHGTEPHYFLTLKLVRRRVVGGEKGTEETPIWDEKDLPCCFERSLPKLTHISLHGSCCSGLWICVKKIR